MSHTTDTSAPADAPATAPVTLESADIQRLIPHRFPMLLIDRVVELVPRQRIVAIKNVSANEPFFTGHFPGFPIMPGVLIVEALAQAGAVLIFSDVEDIAARDSKLVVFTGIEKARFRRPVRPGDQLRLEITVLSWRRTAGRMQGYAYIGEKVAAEAIITCALVDRVRTPRASDSPSNDDSSDASS